MNQEFSDPEIFSDFIIEAKEHLETIEPNLLLLERRPGDLGLLDAIFRPMHSLKGASGFLGLPQINGLAHKAENILDELRKGNLQVSPEIMDIILAATDALRSMIENLETSGMEGDVETRSIMDRINAVLSGAVAPAASTGKTDAPSPEPAHRQVATSQAGTGSPQSYPLSAVSGEHLTDFLEEAHEIVANLNQALLELERNPQADASVINDIFRYMHNLKGNSGLLGYLEMNALSHEAESLLGLLRKGDLRLERNHVDLLLSSVDQIDGLIGKIDAQAMTVTPTNVQPVIQRLRQARQGALDESVSAALPPRTEAAPSSSQPADAPLAPDMQDIEDAEIFAQTAKQQLDNMRLALANLAKDGTQKDYVDGLYRSLVSLQNASNYMGFDELKIYAERTAKLVDQAREADMGFELFVDLLSQERSILEDMVAAVLKTPQPSTTLQPSTQLQKPSQPASAGQAQAEQRQDRPDLPPQAPDSAPKPAPAKPCASEPVRQDAGSQPKTKASSTIRVDHERLDHLMNLIGELIINRNRFAMLSKSLEENPEHVEHVAQQLTESTYAMARISDDLQDTIMQVRMVAVSAVFSRFPRLVRDLSRKSGKEVELVTEGEETELDKSIVEVIGDPLVHLIRNSMDHGLENREERLAAGKPATGSVWLRAYHKGNSVAIEVEDDGRGIDPVKMRQVAVKKGLMAEEEAARLDDREAVELIFAPGFSSAEKITDISGRGVGMDVVRTNIKNLKGSVNITSELGKGTKMILSLPLTLAIIDALMVTVAGATYAIPLDAVSETTKIEAGILTDVGGRKAVTLRDEVLGIVDLTDLLGLPCNNQQREILPIVVITDNDRRLGLVVDRLLERQEVVIKPLGAYLGDIDGISGATIMGDGSVVLILDPHEIYGLATSRPGRT
ncbi:MAG TPA: chemotaxis protein CheA [Desulfonatronum sp.]|nr:chemotaxis protein CheA [Desulfonatronum sp.]